MKINKFKKIILVLLVIGLIFLAGCSKEKAILGPIGSMHGHVDIKIYILGNPIDLSMQKYQQLCVKTLNFSL